MGAGRVRGGVVVGMGESEGGEIVPGVCHDEMAQWGLGSRLGDLPRGEGGWGSVSESGVAVWVVGGGMARVYVLRNRAYVIKLGRVGLPKGLCGDILCLCACAGW